MTRRAQTFEQDLLVVAFDHPAPGQTATAAAGTLTCDTKANSTARDYFILNDGSNKAMLSYNVAGTDAAQYSKLGSKASATLTCSTKANITNEDYVTVWDGHRFWKIMYDTDASGDSTGTADIVVNVNGLTTAAEIVTATVNAIMETTSVPGMVEACHLTATDGTGDTVVLTCDDIGYKGNGTNTENMTHADFTLTAATGGTDPFPAEEFSHVDISSATTAAEVATLMHTAINALTEVLITSTDNADGTLTLANDVAGPQGNASQQYSETGSTLMALTDMTGGAWVDATGATMASKLFTCQRPFRVDKVEYVNPTGLAGHGSNYWEIGIKKGSTVMAQWSTDSDVAGQGTLTANTIVNPVLSATAANLVAAKDDVISFFATKVASAANLPAGRIIIHGRYL